ncbi:permease [Streptococcus entericus]|uniref:permease n=1 Tax=Streptococcus entericus TaxID=155680 RepID=UPI00035CB491|nr:permease [Streptococcus entericus]
MTVFSQLPHSVLQLFAIFLSIIIEALPFVFLGAILSGFIDVFVTPDRLQSWLPKNKVLSIVFGTFIGFVFPSCECGIVPIVGRFLKKKVPSYTAIPFMATAPVINPIVLFATYSAFGHSFRIMFLRFLGSSLVAIVLGLLLGFVLDPDILDKQAEIPHLHHYSQLSVAQKVFAALAHAIDEIFDVGRYLVFGALLAASMQIYIPTRLFFAIDNHPLIAILLMMLLAFVMSLCSEADAFIGASLMSNFGLPPVMAFLLFGPIIDIKNLLLMFRVFKKRFIGQFIGVAGGVVLIYCLILEVIG